MSIQAMQWVIEHSRHQGGEFLTLLMLANHAGSDGWECWPSVPFLASECRLSPRQVQRNLRRLEAGGEISMKHGEGPHGTHLYQVLGVTSMSGRQSVTPDATVTGGGDIAVSPQGRHPRHPNRKEPSSEPSSISFNRFYEAFPRHQGKGAARKAYERALGKADEATILAGAEQYRDDRNREAEFTCLPATWLNQERWADDPLPWRGGNGQAPAPKEVYDPDWIQHALEREIAKEEARDRKG